MTEKMTCKDADLPNKHGQDGVVVIQVVKLQVLAHAAYFGVGNVVSVEDVELARDR